MWVGLLVRDSRAFYLKDISVNHITPPPSFGADHIRQPRRPGFLNGLIVGLDEPVVLLNRDESEQHQTHMITPCSSQRLLTRRNRSGRNLHVCRVTCRTADKECGEEDHAHQSHVSLLAPVTVPRLLLVRIAARRLPLRTESVNTAAERSVCSVPRPLANLPFLGYTPATAPEVCHDLFLDEQPFFYRRPLHLL